MTIYDIIDELARDLTAVPVPKAKSEVRRILRTKLEAMLGEIQVEIEKAKLLEVAVNPERLLQKQFYNNGLGKAAAIIESKK